ncbi:MAG: AP2 domain-containing protein [Peptococcaceae bacterium]|nr:AP2 domain-containing protein [Peptococcaceae bacterium]
MNNKSGVTGVFWIKPTGRWLSQIKIKKKTYYLGNYDTVNEARIAREQAQGRIADGSFFAWYEEKSGKPRYEDLSGQRFGRLVAISFESKKKNSYWTCKCDCGNETSVSANSLRLGEIKSCGCLKEEIDKARSKDMSGQRFGRLLALEKTGEQSKYGGTLWKCQCDCGKIVEVSRKDLVQGHNKSCGCWGSVLENIDGTRVSLIKCTKIRRNNTSGCTGVSFSSRDKKWQAGIGFKGKHYSLGYYSDINEAIKVRKLAEEKLFAPFLEWYEGYREALLKGPPATSDETEE